jgi:hypothetical protein
MATGNVADYVGRTIDVLAFSGLNLGDELLLEQTLAEEGKGGSVITGIQKLVQRWLLEVFKVQGSAAYSTRGTEFIAEARSGFLTNVADIHGSFARAVLTAGINLQAEESATDPLDERYGSAEIDSVQFSQGIAKLFVRLTSLAGDDRAVIFPLEFPI